MFRRSQVAWKTSGLFAVIIVLVLVGTAYLNSLDDRRAALMAARDVTRTHSKIIITTLHRFMVTQDTEGIRELIQDLHHDNPVYEDILLVAHEGRVVTSFDDKAGKNVSQDNWPCSVCHFSKEETSPTPETVLERVSKNVAGQRVLSTVTLMWSKPDCGGTQCHDAAVKGMPLGYLKADYSLQFVDEVIAQHGVKTGVGALVAIVLGALASWLTIQRLITSRLRVLTEGVRRVTAADFDFRFSEGGRDEFSELATEFNKMIRQSKRTREYLEGIVEDSADIIITVDPEGIIQKFNSGAEKILGYNREEVIGERIEKLFSDPSERDTAIAKLEYSDHVVNYQTHFLTKDGQVRDVILTLSKLRRRDGTVIGTYGISKDVTREKRLLRQLLQSEKMAALGQAITGIQHSVKNLLNVLKGGSYMVKTGLAKEDKDLLNEGWEMVQEGIAHMTELSTNMLQFAKERSLNIKETSLSELVKAVFGLTEASFRDEEVELVLELDDDLPLVNCDRELIHSVLMDLLSNALDACSWKDYKEDEKPRVTLSLPRDAGDGYARIEVRDNGEGMSEEVRAKIFTPFFSTKKKKGTGMGLAVASRIVASHGGKILVDSETGRGTVFRVLLPYDGSVQGEES